MLRVIQDTFIDDAGLFAASIQAALPQARHWIAAGLERCQRDGHRRWCEQLGLPFRNELEFPQGAVMLAPAVTWREVYLDGLPADITHFWDDLMMGELLRHRGGRLIDLPRSWTHRHHCEPEVARNLYEAHRGEVDCPRQAPATQRAARVRRRTAGMN
jgi:hypothetical protein